MSTDSQQITQASGSNLAFSFFSLAPEKKQAMNTFYAFCRIIDDIADSTTLTLEEKKSQLQGWREEIYRAYQSEPETPLGRELADIIRRYLIPPTPIEEIINGMEMDLSKTRYADFNQLSQYCYRAASAVGLVSIEIFTYQHSQTRDYAVALGMAFQLTNILRDVKKDASFGRIYLPQNELVRFGVTEEDIFQERFTPALRRLLAFQYHRASHYFAKSLRLLHPEDRPHLLAAEVMRGIYHGLLENIRKENYDVFTRPVHFNKWQKLTRALAAQRREKKPVIAGRRPQRVVVLGGGWAGLSAGIELTRRGHQVTLLESKGFLGGRACSFPDPQTGEMIDNGQHILMGCYHETLRLFDYLQVQDRLWTQPRLRIPYRSSRGESCLQAGPWPAPLHLLQGLFQFSELDGADRWAASQLSTRLRLGQRPKPEETVSTWLARWRQTPNLIRAVWEPLCLAAVNLPCQTASATLFATVIDRALLGGAHDSTIQISRVGLSDLLQAEASAFIEAGGGQVVRNVMVSELRFENNRCTSVCTQNAQNYTPDQVVSALSWKALGGLLPPGTLKDHCRQLGDASIISLYLWFDRPLMDEPFIGFLDSPIHWLFNSDLIHGPSSTGLHRYAVVISGCNDLNDMAATELEEITLRELRRFLPAAKEAQLQHRFLYKSKSATFQATPAVEKIRPGAKTPWENFWLAGDWTKTGLPATLEGAIVSGRLAADALDRP